MKYILNLFFAILLIFILSSDCAYADPEQNEYKERRSKFIAQMENGIALFAGNKEINFSRGASYRFRQNGDFYYLTGYNKPGAVLLIVKGNMSKSVLFIEKSSVFSEIYNGAEYTFDNIKKIYGFDEVYYKNDLDEELNKLRINRSKVYYSFNDDELTDKINSLFESNYGKPEEIINTELITRDLRVIKSQKEIALLQKAIDITNKAHLEVANNLKPGINESRIAALIEYTFRINGSEQDGFSSIVGSGVNSCVLHYQDNDQEINDNTTVVVDIGAEFKDYSADVTRTYPSGGKFTDEQKDIYNIVLKAQLEAIKIIKPGIKLQDVNKKTVDIISKELLKLGLITDAEKRWQTKLWYPHGSSHWLGLDAHDAGDYKYRDGGRALEPGMVFTVEPGIYISGNIFDIAEKFPSGFIPDGELEKFKRDIKTAFEKYKNIGVRIEDDILVTESGFRNLSEEFPRKAEEIEKLMNK